MVTCHSISIDGILSHVNDLAEFHKFIKLMNIKSSLKAQ